MDAMRLVTELLLPRYHSITSCEACQPPVRNGAPAASCRCSVRSRFPRFPARGNKAVHGPRAAGGGAPARRTPAPPARAEQGARGGRGRPAPTRARRNSRGSTEPPASRGHARGRRISEGPTAGRGGARASGLWPDGSKGRPLAAARPSSDGGSGGPPSGRPSPSDEAPGRRARGHEERVERTNSAGPAASERAAREGESAAAAATTTRFRPAPRQRYRWRAGERTAPTPEETCSRQAARRADLRRRSGRRDLR